MSVRTRFAPSPTGYLHIGGVRTALFCWIFARKHGGQFILRIDDTDQQRNVDEALGPILRGLQWLGIDWDEGPEVGGPCAPYYQSQRADRHRAAVTELLKRGFAYYDYATTEEIQQERAAAQTEKRSFVYSRRFMAETDADRARFEAEGRKAVVRLKMPREGRLVLDDLVRGRVEFDWAQEQDHVVQRADGSCLYHLASVVDDEDFGITHVIRAEEHLSNTPRQVFILQSLGYRMPQYAHLPFVAEPGSRNKLSKRKLAQYLKNKEFAALMEHGQQIANRLGLTTSLDTFNPVITDFYRQVGYLPEAIVNYLALLGWSLDDRTEQFSQRELIDSFTLERVNKAPASFDPKKLRAFQERYMLALPLETKTDMVLPYVEKAGWTASPATTQQRDRVARLLAAAGDRVKTAGDILAFPEFFTADATLPTDSAALARHLGSAETIDRLRRYRDRIAAVEPFDAATLDRATHEFAVAEGIKIGEIIHAIRVAATGKTVGIGLFDALALLGRESALARIDRALREAEARVAST